MRALGKHLIVELYGCSFERTSDPVQVEQTLIEAVRLSKATIVKPVFHHFSPHGVSGVIVIAESHFTIHTWPEHGYCALDIFTCGDQIDSAASLQFLKESFQAHNMSVMEIQRGMLDQPEREPGRGP
jgi:S-adenosylmethionine decarboxylase